MEGYFSLGLFRLLPAFRRLEAEAQEHLKEEFALLLRRLCRAGGSLRAYSLVGLSAEADLLLFQGAEDPKAFQALRREANRTRFMGYLEPVALFLDRGEGEPGMTPWPSSPTGWKAPLLRGRRSSRGGRWSSWRGPSPSSSPWRWRRGGIWPSPGASGKLWTTWAEG
jgi:hypothetical protein